ncbi:MAG: hypothetical protein KDE47_04545 [Caldilineaceae bacterium]|nr:hypothetical protein [Caldilineaceae bacterium]
MKWLTTRAPILLLHFITLGLCAVALYVYRLPPTLTAIPEEGSAESQWWGLWPVTYLSPTVFLSGLAIILLTASLLWYFTLPEAPRATTNNAHPSSHRHLSQWPYFLLTAGFIGAFYAFPISHTRWGDAYILTKAIAHPDPAIRLSYSWQAPLDLFLHSQVWRYFHDNRGWQDAMPVYHLLSPVAGLLYLSAAAVTSKASARYTATPQWLSFGLVTSLGVMQLFFGYIENYSYAAAGILLYLGLGLLTLRQQCPLWVAALALAITNAFHPSTIVYWPAMLWLSWQDISRRNKGWHSSVYQVLLPPLLVVAGTVILMEWGGHGIVTLFTTDRPGGGDARWLVPLWATTTRWERYTMFSWPHLRDLLNEQLLVGPILLPTLLAAWLSWRLWRQPEENHFTKDKAKSGLEYIVFLAIGTVCHLLLIWLWNPDYGGQRDWDLFSLAMIPTALLVAHMLPRLIANPRVLLAGMIPLLMLQYAQLATWIYQNTLRWVWP